MRVFNLNFEFLSPTDFVLIFNFTALKIFHCYASIHFIDNAPLIVIKVLCF